MLNFKTYIYFLLKILYRYHPSQCILIKCNAFEFRIVKMSSPNINNMLLLGCVICYSSVFINPLEVSKAVVCWVCSFLYFLSIFSLLSLIYAFLFSLPIFGNIFSNTQGDLMLWLPLPPVRLQSSSIVFF